MQVGAPPIESKKPRGMKIAYSSCIAGTATEVKPYEPPPGVVPASDTQAVMAMDATPYDYANEVPMGGVFFAGYQILAALAQRPEHRVVVATLAEEHTRKWIEIKATGDEDKADKIKDIEDAIEDALGVSVTFNGNDDRFYRIMAVFNGDIGTASHEAVHIGWSILRGASVEIDEDNHEMLAYLTDWLLTEFMRNFKLETRCKKQNGSKRGEAESVAQTAPQS